MIMINKKPQREESVIWGHIRMISNNSSNCSSDMKDQMGERDNKEHIADMFSI